MYQADIVGKTMNNGRLRVEVSFFDGKDSFTDTFETVQNQDDTWIGEQIKRRIKHLNSLDSLKENIAIGSFQEVSATKTDAEIYQEKRAIYLNFMNEARMGVIPYDRPAIVELKEWLKNNFQDEYLIINH